MTRGGKRPGAGRPAGGGVYGEKTKLMRVPESMVTKIQQYLKTSVFQLPLYGSKVSAGYPSPADDHLEGKIDLNELLIKNPSATFLVRVAGDSMIDAGIHHGDTLIVDRSIPPTHNKIVIAVLENELTVKRLEQTNHSFRLLPANKNYKPIEITEDAGFSIWGVVTKVLHNVL